MKRNARSLTTMKHTKTGFIKTQVIAVGCKHIRHKIQVDYREQTLLALCGELQYEANQAEKNIQNNVTKK